METPHATMVKFGYPAMAVADYECWTVQLRPKQATLGAVLLICKENVTEFSAISAAAFAELPRAIRAIETTLRAKFLYSRINYLMLMMVDPHVHFHVLPRYDGTRDFRGVEFIDPAWPGAPDLAFANIVDAKTVSALTEELREDWTRP